MYINLAMERPLTKREQVAGTERLSNPGTKRQVVRQPSAQNDERDALGSLGNKKTTVMRLFCL